MDHIAIFIVSTIASLWITRKSAKNSLEILVYNGSCHCHAVQFQVQGPSHLVVWDCNCSICKMKKNWHFIVPEKNFKLLSGQESLTEYRFNTKVAKHMFCKICGVQAFYRPRSNPDGYAVTFACISIDQVRSHEIVKFEGKTWEDFYVKSGIEKFSKLPG